MIMIKLKDIVKRYTDGDEMRCVIDHLSLEVNDGNFVSITGESGAGKTTLLSILGTMLQADFNTRSLNITSSHLVSVFLVSLSTMGISSLLHSQPARKAST